MGPAEKELRDLIDTFVPLAEDGDMRELHRHLDAALVEAREEGRWLAVEQNGSLLVDAIELSRREAFAEAGMFFQGWALAVLQGERSTKHATGYVGADLIYEGADRLRAFVRKGSHEQDEG